MKINQLKITSSSNDPDPIIFNFRDPDGNSQYNIKGATGLDAEEIVAQFYKTSGGGIAGAPNAYNLVLPKRDIVILTELNPRFANYESYSDLRNDLYKKIAGNKSGSLTLSLMLDGIVIATIKGKISKLEAPTFSKTQEAQITIACDSPFFRGNGLGVNVSSLSDVLIQDLTSTAPHGFDLNFIIQTGFASLSITDPNDSSWKFEVTPTTGFIAGDSLIIDTHPSQRTCYITRSGSTINLADRIGLDSSWPVVFPGDNHFAFSNPTSILVGSLGYTEAFWGV